MKQLVMILSFLVMSSVMAWAQNEADIPPPPMPEYMKKHQQKFETQEVPKHQKLQVSQPEPKAKAGKFLNEEDHKKVFQKEFPKIDEPVEESQSAHEVKEEFLEAAEANQEGAAFGDDDQEESLADMEDAEEAPTDYPDIPDEVNPVKTVEGNSAQFEKPKAQENRQPVSTAKPFKAGMNRFSKNCSMHAQPDATSATVGSVSEGKKLWVDKHNSQWHKVYKKSGAVFISADCL